MGIIDRENEDSAYIDKWVFPNVLVIKPLLD